MKTLELKSSITFKRENYFLGYKSVILTVFHFNEKIFID
jgi:hypothetical protein